MPPTQQLWRQGFHSCRFLLLTQPSRAQPRHSTSQANAGNANMRRQRLGSWINR
jgi:hypothetical protein